MERTRRMARYTRRVNRRAVQMEDRLDALVSEWRWQLTQPMDGLRMLVGILVLGSFLAGLTISALLM